MTTKSELLSKAPEGATHYYKRKGSESGFVRFYKQLNENHYLYFYGAGYRNSLESDIWLKENLAPIPQPIKENWFENGNLPTDGEICEAWDWEEEKWVSGKFLMKGNSDHAFACGAPESWGKLFWACKFRPLKSYREKCIEEALSKINTADNGVYDAKMLATTFAAIWYDAGLLRISEDK